jgi:hypothetical protein
MIIYGRYLGLKENTEDKKKKVEFIATGETLTQDNTENNEQQAPKKNQIRAVVCHIGD